MHSSFFLSTLAWDNVVSVDTKYIFFHHILNISFIMTKHETQVGRAKSYVYPSPQVDSFINILQGLITYININISRQWCFMIIPFHNITDHTRLMTGATALLNKVILKIGLLLFSIAHPEDNVGLKIMLSPTTEILVIHMKYCMSSYCLDIEMPLTII